MGIVHVNVRLSNPRKGEMHPVEVEALVETGAITLCIPEHVRIQLDLEELECREVTVADGRKEVVPYVGPIKVTCLGRSCYTGALVLGDRTLLGAAQIQIPSATPFSPAGPRLEWRVSQLLMETRHSRRGPRQN
jgi:clan AA aspartic protease